MSEKALNAPQFVLKLLCMLENNGDVIDWNQTRTEIIVKNVKIFSEQVLPNYFRHNKLESFVRQLNMYNFFKVSSHRENSLGFKHHLFFEGNEENFFKIKRKKKHGGKERGLDAVEQNLSSLIKQKIPDNCIKKIVSDLLEFKSFSSFESKKVDTFFQKLVPEMKASKFKKYAQTLNLFTETAKTLRDQSQAIDQAILQIQSLEAGNNPIISSNRVLSQIPDFKSPLYPNFLQNNLDLRQLEQPDRKEEQFDYRSPSLCSQLQPFFSVTKFFVLNDFKTPPSIFREDYKEEPFLRRFSGEGSHFNLNGEQQSDY